MQSRFRKTKGHFVSSGTYLLFSGHITTHTTTCINSHLLPISESVPEDWISEDNKVVPPDRDQDALTGYCREVCTVVFPALPVNRRFHNSRATSKAPFMNSEITYKTRLLKKKIQQQREGLLFYNSFLYKSMCVLRKSEVPECRLNGMGCGLSCTSRFALSFLSILYHLLCCLYNKVNKSITHSQPVFTFGLCVCWLPDWGGSSWVTAF